MMKQNFFFGLGCFLALSGAALTENCLAANATLEQDHQVEPPAKGNFSLPGSQQPGPLIAFGGNILEQGQTQIGLGVEIIKGRHQSEQVLTPTFVYAVTDRFSLTAEVPVVMRAKEFDARSSSVGDALLQFESAFYTHANANYEEEATLVTGFSLPTGDKDAVPATGLGTNSYFLGATFTRTYEQWLWFATLGTQLSSQIEDTKAGKAYLYEFGFGKTFCTLPGAGLLAWVIEFDGAYTRKEETHSEEFGWEKDGNSGGNVIFLTPSLFAASRNLAFQLGAGFPIVQQINGVQNKNHYLLAANLTLTLY